MKKVHHILLLVCSFQFLISISLNAQTRTYYTNRAIAGQTEDGQGTNYLLLHKIYAGTLLADNFVMGKITGIRGNAASWNRKWTVEVNTASAYNTTRGSIISYNEPATLVTLTYNSESYLAVSITNSSALFNFSFTGYAQNESLLIAADNSVSNVQPFTTTLDPIIMQGNVGIGTTSTGIHKLAVEGSIGARRVKVNQTGWADFVFQPDYQLPSLHEIETYIKSNQHLPGIPTAAEVEKEGLDLGETDKKLLQKIEELTLYLIDQQKQLKSQQEQINLLRKQLRSSTPVEGKHQK